MKKSLIISLITLCIMYLSSCKSNSSMDAQLTQDTVPTERIEQYSGTLPCEDCQGIITFLSLSYDETSSEGTFVLKEKYQGKVANDSIGDGLISTGRFITQKDTLDTSKEYIHLIMSDRPDEDEDTRSSINSSIIFIRQGNDIVRSDATTAVLKRQ